MNLEQLRQSNWIIFEAISGSHAYGTNVEGSDTDIRGVYIQPTEDMLGLTTYIPQVSDEKNDITFYEIGRFIELAAKGNPNIMELLNMPEEQIIYKDPIFDEYFPSEVKEQFMTTKLKHTFTGYAYAQIKKARGLNKKINWDKSKMQRKDVLDFCYVIGYQNHKNLWQRMVNTIFDNREDSVPFKHWVKSYGETIPLHIVNESLGLAKVNNAPDLYSLYCVQNNVHGIASIDITDEVESNDIRLTSIPKKSSFLAYLRFDRNAYSSHCKDYKEYTEWVEKRNPERYRDNLKGEQGYDHKNMMHCFRLLGMAEDIATGKGIVVKRPNREFLLKIRNGEIPYDELLNDAEAFVEKIEEQFDNADLPKQVSMKYVNALVKYIRVKNIH